MIRNKIENHETRVTVAICHRGQAINNAINYKSKIHTTKFNLQAYTLLYTYLIIAKSCNDTQTSVIPLASES